MTDSRMACIEDLLAKTSRTFAAAIPLLPERLRNQVTLAYLLFRAADTIEDAVGIPKQRKIDLFEGFLGLLENDGSIGWPALPPEMVSRDWDAKLLQQSPALVALSHELPASVSAIILGHLRRSVSGMQQFVEQGDMHGNVQLESLQQLREYCYAVAGIVGEMLTDLIVEDVATLVHVKSELLRRAAKFGEGLQLVNVLNDLQEDRQHGRRFLPVGIHRRQLVDLSGEDLKTALEYVAIVEGAGGPEVSFSSSSCQFGWPLKTFNCTSASLVRAVFPAKTFSKSFGRFNSHPRSRPVNRLWQT